MGQLLTKQGQRLGEFTIDPLVEFHVTKSTMYLNESLGSSHELRWSQQNDQWFVSRIKTWRVVNVNTNLALEGECTLLSFHTNVEIDPELFEPKSLDKALEPTTLPKRAPR